jgi:hypothetical protein
LDQPQVRAKENVGKEPRPGDAVHAKRAWLALVANVNKNVYIQLVSAQLKEGVDEETLLKASDAFQRGFVSKQEGVLKRVLMRAKTGGYADLVFFESKDAADRVAAAEQTSEVCRQLFELMQPPNQDLPDMGILSFEHLRTYE